MKKTILVFGGISGLILAALLFITVPLYKNGALSLDNGAYVGYTTMLVAATMIFVGVKSYRDKELKGVISFGKGFQVGLLITVLSAIIYAAAWEINLHFVFPDFMDLYVKCSIERAQHKGVSPEKMKSLIDQMDSMKVAYANPFIRFGMTVFEVFPVGLLVSLASAGILRKKQVLPA